MLSTLPERLQSIYKPIIVDAEDSPEWPIVKAADTISAYMKCDERTEGQETTSLKKKHMTPY